MSAFPMKCGQCSKEFSTNGYYKRHIQQCHKINATKRVKIIVDYSKTKFVCRLCNKQFGRNNSLQRHIDAIHSSTNELSKSYNCNRCDFKTIHKSNLKRHISVVHENSKENKPSTAAFQCSRCSAKFSCRKNLKFHERKTHNVGELTLITKRSCPLCAFVAYGQSTERMLTHFEHHHQISINWETKQFKTIDDFNSWKKDTERVTKSSFVKLYSTKQSAYYRCHRCGTYRTKGQNKRRMKTIGSCKINGYCPAAIKVKIQKNNLVDVLYLPTHVGHENELKHLKLSLEDRKSIATQLAGKTPHEEILKGIKSLASNCDLERIHLCKRKDIFNIESSFNLNKEAVDHPLDSVGIETWVRSVMSKDTALLVYKPQGIISDEFPQLVEEDFLLVYMTEAQKLILQKYSHDVVCIERTCCTLSSCGFKLYSLLTVDESREGFPVAFMSTNRDDEAVITHFFEQIMNVTGRIKTNVFMSDTEEFFYNAWCKIMGPSNLRVYSTGHVLKTWRASVNSKIENEEKGGSVYNVLQALLCEIDKKSFKEMLQESLTKMSSDEDTKLFWEYFKNDYVSGDRYKFWAHCYHIDAGINTSVFIENFNKTLKYCYLQEKKVKHQEKSLCTTLNLLKDNYFDLIEKIKKSELIKKQQRLRIRHSSSLVIEPDNLLKLDDKWVIKPPSCTECYSVKRVKFCKTCQLQCSHCNSCFHEFVCTCADNTIENNMCEHIHLVAQKVQTQNKTNNTDSDADCLMDVEVEHETEFIGGLDFISSCVDNVIDNNMCEHGTPENRNTQDKTDDESIDGDCLTDVEEVQDTVFIEDSLNEVIVTNEPWVSSAKSHKMQLLQEIEKVEKYIQENDLTDQQLTYARLHVKQIIPVLKAMNSSAL